MDQQKDIWYMDKQFGKAFIPAFRSKEVAQQCFMIMPKDIIKEKYEVQAIIYEDLITYAQQTNHKVFILNDRGNVLESLR